MTHPIRPVKTFILRLWREPGDPKEGAGWRGLIRPLDASAAIADGKELSFNGLENLLAALRASTRTSPVHMGRVAIFSLASIFKCRSALGQRIGFVTNHPCLSLACREQNPSMRITAMPIAGVAKSLEFGIHICPCENPP